MGKRTKRLKLTKLTPAMAAAMLKADKEKREPSKRHVERIARAIKAGDWDFRGQTIKISANGTIIDGLHRLHACVLAGVAIEIVLV